MYIHKIIRPFLNWWYQKHPPEMVSWWKTKEKVRAKRVRMPGGDYQMLLEGEKYPQPNYPRGHILFGNLSKLKHEVKNQIFNRSWHELEHGKNPEEINNLIKYQVLPEIFALLDKYRYDMLPYETLSAPLKEIWRAFGVVEKKLPRERALRAQKIKELVCFILQEDDAYRFRFQWLAQFIDPNIWWRKLIGRHWQKDLEWGLSILEHAEIVGDMKERQRLLRRVTLMILRDKEMLESFEMLIHELDWQKLRLTKADKYYFRGKYFKVDYPYYSY